MMHAAPDPVSLLALGLTALLPAWLPLASLAAFAAACGVLGVSDPEILAAAFGII